MPKTDLQIQNFLTYNRTYRSKTDKEMIYSFCSDKIELPVMTFTIDPENGLSASEFIEWFENGFGSGDIVAFSDKIGIIGKSHFKTSTIAGILSDDKILISDIEMPPEGFKMAKSDDSHLFHAAMFRNRLQFDYHEGILVEKYIPQPSERVIFEKENLKGIGVVREIDFKTGDVELFCYFIYQTKQCGYSMHEKGICNLNDFAFHSIENPKTPSCKSSAQHYQRKLNKELNKYGKTWNQPQHRVEPLKMKAGNEDRYWYIDSNLKLKEGIEHIRQRSHDHYLAGNYFLKPSHALIVLEKFNEILRDYLASPESNP